MKASWPYKYRAREGEQKALTLPVYLDVLVLWLTQQVAQRVRWKILGELPFVADVMVSIAVETKPCPAMSSLRPQEDIEQVGVVVGAAAAVGLVVVFVVLRCLVSLALVAVLVRLGYFV